MKEYKNLKKTCKELCRNIKQNQNDFSKYNIALYQLFDNYLHSDVLMYLREELKLEDMINFCSKVEFEQKKLEKISTIGVFYWKMYNGGVEKIIANCIGIWSEMGYRVVLYTDQEPSELDYKYPESVKRVVLPKTIFLNERLKEFEKSILEERVDLFINNAWMPVTLLWEMMLVKSYNIPYIIYTHGDFRAMYNVLDDYSINHHKIFKKADMILTISKLTEYFYHSCGCNTKLVYNPLPQELINVEDKQEDRSSKLLWIGRFDKGKRPSDAIRILKKVNEAVPNARLEMVGTGDFKIVESTKQLVKELGLENKVRFHGYQDEVKKFYKEAAVMLMTSEMEGYPTVLLESKAYAVPCVMYELPCSSLIENGKGILCAPVGSEDKLADYIIELLQDDSRRYELGSAARESFDYLKDYDFVNMWRDIFDEIVNNEKDLNCSDNMSNMDNIVLPLFVKQLERANKQTKLKIIEYKIGYKILEVPRKLKKIFHRRV